MDNSIDGLLPQADAEVAAVPPRDFPAIVAAMIFGTLVFQAMSIAPILLGALVEAGRLTNASLGAVSTIELLGIAAGSTLGPYLLRKNRPRVHLFAACIALLLLNLLCTIAPGAVEIGLLRAACGLLEGLLLSSAMLTIVASENPESMNGIFLGLTAIPQVIGAYVLSSSAIPLYGANIGFELMAVTALVAAAACSRVACASPEAEAEARHSGFSWSPLKIAALATIALQNAAIGATFSYLVQFALQDGVPDQSVGIAMAALQFLAVVGALMVGIVAYRLKQEIVLTIGNLVQVVVVLAIVYVPGPGAYIVGCGLFGLLWNSLVPFGLKLLLELDPTRRLGLYSAAASLGGLGVGPLLASRFVDEHDVAPALHASALAFAIAAALFLLINLARYRQRAVAAGEAAAEPWEAADRCGHRE